jgi:hypothetical protein
LSAGRQQLSRSSAWSCLFSQQPRLTFCANRIRTLMLDCEKMKARQSQVRFTPESGHSLTTWKCLLSANSGHCTLGLK